MTHFMIDNETLAKTPNAVILSIGVCAFDPESGYIHKGREFKLNASLQPERKIDFDTVLWWMNQGPEAKAEAMLGDNQLSIALRDLATYIRDNTAAGTQPKVWGNGATFDISMLEDAYREKSIPCPWDFWNVRDVRTIVDLCKGAIDRKDFPFEGTPHCAVDDARHQAKYVSAMWQRIRAGLK